MINDETAKMALNTVEAIEKTSNQVIYLPTEASVPITESARMAQKATAGK